MPCHGPFGINFLVRFLDPSALEVAGALAPVVELFYGWPDPALVAPSAGRTRPSRPALVARPRGRLRGEVMGSVDLGARRVPVPRRSPLAATRSFEGDVGATTMYAGTGVGAVRADRSAAEVLADLVPDDAAPV